MAGLCTGLKHVFPGCWESLLPCGVSGNQDHCCLGSPFSGASVCSAWRRYTYSLNSLANKRCTSFPLTGYRGEWPHSYTEVQWGLRKVGSGWAAAFLIHIKGTSNNFDHPILASIMLSTLLTFSCLTFSVTYNVGIVIILQLTQEKIQALQSWVPYTKPHN